MSAMNTTTRMFLLANAVITAAAFSAPPYYDTWTTYKKADGLPSNKALCVRATQRGAVWVGTDEGLARLRDGNWMTFTKNEGLTHNAVMAIAEDTATGDIWIATMGGLTRYSAGRFDRFTQLNSGLANDVVYGLAVVKGEVWAATAAGTSRYEIAKKRWTIFNESNTPMHEIWCYSAVGADDKVYVAVWGGGLLEYTKSRDRWKDYRDPDGEMEIDLFRNDGLIHDVLASVAYDEAGRLWIATYFGLSTYDGRKWRNFMEDDSPLVSNFVNFAATHGKFGWLGTDNGLNASDRETWWTYQRDDDTGKGIVVYTPPNGQPERFTTQTAIPHNFVLGINFQGDDIWVATEDGVARGQQSRRVAARGPSSAEKGRTTHATTVRKREP